VIDDSTNGTWLNTERLPRREFTLLADGDCLEPAQVVGLQVCLLAAGGTVHAIGVERNDALADRLSYLLTDARIPTPMPLAAARTPILWLAWIRNEGPAPVLAVCAAGSREWKAVEAGRHRLLGGRYHVYWEVLDSPVEQDHYLCPVALPGGGPGQPPGAIS
jgi:hypothetical protein